MICSKFSKIWSSAFHVTFYSLLILFAYINTNVILFCFPLTDVRKRESFTLATSCAIRWIQLLSRLEEKRRSALIYIWSTHTVVVFLYLPYKHKYCDNVCNILHRMRSFSPVVVIHCALRIQNILFCIELKFIYKKYLQEINVK